MFGLSLIRYPRQDSNLCTSFRKRTLYPLSYGGLHLFNIAKYLPQLKPAPALSSPALSSPTLSQM